VVKLICLFGLGEVTDCTKIDKEIYDLISEIDVVLELVRKCVKKTLKV